MTFIAAPSMITVVLDEHRCEHCDTDAVARYRGTDLVIAVVSTVLEDGYVRRGGWTLFTPEMGTELGYVPLSAGTAGLVEEMQRVGADVVDAVRADIGNDAI